MRTFKVHDQNNNVHYAHIRADGEVILDNGQNINDLPGLKYHDEADHSLCMVSWVSSLFKEAIGLKI